MSELVIQLNLSKYNDLTNGRILEIDKGGSMKANKSVYTNAPSGYVMFVAFFGALVYFINHAHGFWEVIFSFIQAAVWPGIVLYHVLQLLLG